MCCAEAPHLPPCSGVSWFIAHHLSRGHVRRPLSSMALTCVGVISVTMADPAPLGLHLQVPLSSGQRRSVCRRLGTHGPCGCRPFDIGLEHRGRHPWVGGLDPVCAEGWPQSRLGGVEGGRGLRSVWGCVRGSAVCSTEAAAVAALSPRPRGQLRLWVARLPVPPALSPGSLRSALSSASLFLRVRLGGSRFGKHDGFLISHRSYCRSYG